MINELRLLADYYQIHLCNEGSVTDLGDAWDEQAVTDQFATAGDAAAIGTVVNVFVSVTVQVLDHPPANDSIGFDYVVEGSLQIPSGRMVVMGCTDYEPEAARFAVPAGWVRVRVARSNLDVAYSLGVDSDEDPTTMERLRVQVWPAATARTKVLKRWNPQPT